MENIALRDHEAKHFADLFAICDCDNSGKVSGPNASELFIKSGLSRDVLHEVHTCSLYFELLRCLPGHYKYITAL